jgi:hypothetical protein
MSTTNADALECLSTGLMPGTERMSFVVDLSLS